MSPISIRIKNREAQRSTAETTQGVEAPQENARDVFWRPFLVERERLAARTAGMLPPDETEIPLRERTLEGEIAKHLRQSLIEYASETSETPSDAPKRGKRADTRGHARRVLFSVHVTGYSSLDLNLIVGGLDSLNKIFGGDFSLFHVFLDHYLPAAFAAATSPAFAGMMTYDITVPDDVQAAASQTPGGAGGPSALATAAQENAQWIWRVSNFSLVVPVALALGVLYLGDLEVHSLRAEQVAALTAERAQQTALLNSVSDSQLQLLKKVSDQQLDSVKDERSQWAAMQNFEQQYIVEQLKDKASAPASDKHVKPLPTH